MYPSSIVAAVIDLSLQLVVVLAMPVGAGVPQLVSGERSVKFGFNECGWNILQGIVWGRAVYRCIINWRYYITTMHVPSLF